MEMQLRQIPLEDLRLDRNNPRLPGADLSDEDSAIVALEEAADLGELVDSISKSGWINFEPLIVTLEDNEYVVIEGNRRLAALKVISDARLQKLVGVYPPEVLHSDAEPTKIMVNLVEDRDAARAFIGFKHINGAFRWDSYAKAKFAHEWFSRVPNLKEISTQLGDSHSTVSRLINAYSVLHQAEKQGFDRNDIEKKTLHFSHLYTALPSPSVRSFLGISGADAKEVLPADPIPAENGENLLTLMTWLYGQKQVPAVIRSQNPDLGKLVKVLGNSRAVEALTMENDLGSAYTMIIDRSEVFSRAVLKLRKATQDALKSISAYDGSSDTRDNMNDVYEDVDILNNQVDRKYKKAVREQIEASPND